MRARVLYADKNLKLANFRYEDLADPKYKGKVCIRAGQHPYNTALVAALQRKGKRVTVVSTLTTSTPMISDDLRRQADFFLDVAELAKTVGRPQVQRPVEA